MASAASQTVQSGFRPVSADRHIKSRTLSKENILDDREPYRTLQPGSPSKHGSRSLERFVDDDKENFQRAKALKARIHVSSPMREAAERPVSRKPYKTTINTATDTIQYKGFSTENLIRPRARKPGPDTEHYKVPRNKAPVPAEFIQNGSGTVERPERGRHPQFASTSLVRSVERGAGRPRAGPELDREGRRIGPERRSKERNGRAYSGYSTSPDREPSPGRYSRPRPGPGPRSPSSSPVRPPRTRGSPNRDVRREHSGRQVERTPSARAAATSRSPIKKIQRVHNEINGPGREESPSQSRTLSRPRPGPPVRQPRTILRKEESKPAGPVEDDRLARFTEYRGGSEEAGRAGGRRGSAGYELRREQSEESPPPGRERGQSVPPGATIESMRDFYKHDKYRSLYHLPPSPSRPAPVLDRGTGPAPRAATLQREPGPPRRPARTSVSEGELTDDVGRQERVVRQRNKFLSNLLPGRRVSVDREPGLVGRKAVAGQETLQRPQSRSGERVVRRPAPQPPAQLRRGSVEVGETSHSETESPRPAEVGPVLSNSNQLTA